MRPGFPPLSVAGDPGLSTHRGLCPRTLVGSDPNPTTGCPTLFAPAGTGIFKSMKDWIKAYSDIFIKYLFGSPDSSDLLLSFLNSLQSAHGFPLLTAVEVQNPFNLQTALADKLSILDIRAQDQDGRLYDIEIQAAAQPEYPERSLYYWAKVYAGQLSESEAYSVLRPVIGVHILTPSWNAGSVI